ncbi:hypothetical protein EMPG_14024 [Blastomyces silverae]|uniref:Uncharacterized protein n=1 Tax=Blastomyces silverae TaxID=2060906 RepID=A0A0H1BGD8_9EURO|nr:hypothetical protein EMPG_14024 [Blastomyces silverae]
MNGACAKNVELFQVMGFNPSSRANVDGVYSVNAELSPYAYFYPTSTDEDPTQPLIWAGRLQVKITPESTPA